MEGLNLTNKELGKESPDLRVNIGSLELANPVMTASGTFGYAREFENLMNLHRLGAVIVKGISLHPRAGNPPPRIVETACGMLNAIGLQNVGVDRFITEKMPFLISPPYSLPTMSTIFSTRLSRRVVAMSAASTSRTWGWSVCVASSGISA